MAKKQKDNKRNPNKKIDVNDVETMFNDMKDLALNKPVIEEEKQEVIQEEKEITEEEVKEETKKEEVETVESNETEVVEQKETMVEEDLSFIDSITEEKNVIEEEKTEEKIEEKQDNNKRKTYEEMFGYTWMGYGYSN